MGCYLAAIGALAVVVLGLAASAFAFGRRAPTAAVVIIMPHVDIPARDPAYTVCSSIPSVQQHFMSYPLHVSRSKDLHTHPGDCRRAEVQNARVVPRY